MADIEKLCKRMILIDNGKLMYDGELAKIKEMYGDKRIMVVDLEGDALRIGASYCLKRRE